MIRALTIITTLLFASAVFADDAAPQAQPAPVPETPAKPFVYTPKATDIVMGKDTAPVVMVEYASLSCPHCGHFYNTVLPDLTTKYIDTGKVKLVYRDYPLNAPALKAAELVQCADPDRRHVFLKVLFNTQEKWAYDANYKDVLANVAALGGIDKAKFEACMKDAVIEKAILASAKEAQDDYKVQSTPTFFINGKPSQGNHDVENMSKLIDIALTDAGQK